MTAETDRAKPRRDAATIAAICTGIGGSISIIRISGPQAETIGATAWRGRRPLPALPPRTMALGQLLAADGSVEDRCLAVRMPGPHSYTGEDVVEFHCHGGLTVARAALRAVLDAGACHAEPGEFTKRAFINGRLDLTQAEAVADVIQAQSRVALHTANRQLDGLLGRRIEALDQSLRELLAEVEVRLDFVDEDLDWASAETVRATLASAQAELSSLLAHREAGEILRSGVRAVIAGAPNAGKSSLLNLILGRDRAIVSHIPGTTRDTLEETANVRGIPLHLTDTAGIREAGDDIERQGIDRSRSSIADAQVVLWVVDAAGATVAAEVAAAPQHQGLILVANKLDLLTDRNLAPPTGVPLLYISAKSGAGMAELYDEIERVVWDHPQTAEPEIAVNARQAHLLELAGRELTAAASQLEAEVFEVAAVNLRAALDALGRITGRSLQPDILDNIFRRFCIGK